MRNHRGFAISLSLLLGCGVFLHETAGLSISRRLWLSRAVASSGGAILLSSAAPSVAGDDPSSLPKPLRQYTALAPLGDSRALGKKLENQPIEQIAKVLARDLTHGARGKGGYFVTGDLSPEIFRDDCLFIDPTNSVKSLARYQKALTILFEPVTSNVELVGPLEIDEEARTISCRIRSQGILQLPWRPVIDPYESDIVYRIGNDGLIEEQSQTWSISAAKALRETFTPGFLSPPRSSLQAMSDEPSEATKLFRFVNGRRPNSYSEVERAEIDGLVEELANKRYPWKKELLRGIWMLVYLQPGPSGGGVDRRIPFPELPFNDNFQEFTNKAVTNTGQLLGSNLEVRVSGSLREGSEGSLETPKRFVANIDEGRICAGASPNAGGGGVCAALPISGEGIFDGVYLGERLRIGQNINGGGARVVQVKIAYH